MVCLVQIENLVQTLGPLSDETYPQRIDIEFHHSIPILKVYDYSLLISLIKVYYMKT